MVVWRLHNQHRECADCCLEIAPTGAVSITVRCGGELKLTALAIQWQTAQRIVDDSREELLRQGWRQQLYLNPGAISS